ncbi:unnamed protein product [Trichobilharzia szidati]|nr:unnamed protein product [Trichobilharzia szidati]
MPKLIVRENMRKLQLGATFNNDRAAELKRLFVIAMPTMITQLLRFINPSISVMVCGHLSREELDAASLANCIINVLGLSIDTGFSTACDTLFSQAYGSRYRKLVGTFLQRALFVVCIIYLILVCIHLNIEAVLLLLGQEPIISSLTSEYIAYFLPGLGFDFLFLTLARYLQTQSILMPMVYASFTGTAINIAFQYYFVFRMNYGLRASALCLSFSFGCMFLCELGYIITSKVYKSTWDGFNFVSALSNWSVFIQLGVPGIFMVALEEWCFEIMTLIAGTISDVTLGAQAIVFQIQSFIYVIPLGLFTAVNIRVGQKLGAFDPMGARNVYLTALTIVPVVAFCTALPVTLLRNYIPYIFTSDENVCLLASKLLPMLLVFQLCEGFAGISEAVLLACGRQSLGAVTIFFGYYCIGMPIALVLTYKTSLGIFGAWIGLAVGFALTTLTYTICALKTDWFEQARKVKKNLKDNQTMRSTYLSPDVSQYSPSSTENSFDLPIFHQVSPDFVSSEHLLDYSTTSSPILLNENLANWKHLTLKFCFFLIVIILLFISLYLRLSKSPSLWYTHCLQQINSANISTFCINMMPWNTYYKSRSIDQFDLNAFIYSNNSLGV